jgi:hypothetical protein
MDAWLGRMRNGLRKPRWSAAVGVGDQCQRSVDEDGPAERASTLRVIKDQLSNLRGNSFSLPVSFPERVLTLPAWRKWKQRLPGSHMPQLPGRGLRRAPPPLPARPQERRTPPGRAVHVRQHSPRKRPGAHHACSPRRGSKTTDVDRVTRVGVAWLLLLEKVQDVFGAVAAHSASCRWCSSVNVPPRRMVISRGSRSAGRIGMSSFFLVISRGRHVQSLTTHRRQRRDRPSGVNELDGRAFLTWPAACTPGTEFRADR